MNLLAMLLLYSILAASHCHHQWETQRVPFQYTMDATDYVRCDSISIPKEYKVQTPDSLFRYRKCELCGKRIRVFSGPSRAKIWRDSVHAVIDSVLKVKRGKK